jgi:hypothetical protein
MATVGDSCSTHEGEDREWQLNSETNRAIAALTVEGGKMQRQWQFDLARRPLALSVGQTAMSTCEWGGKVLLWLRLHMEK